MDVNDTLVRLVMEFKEKGHISHKTIVALVNRYSLESRLDGTEKNEIERIAVELTHDEEILREFRQPYPSVWQLKRLLMAKFASKIREIQGEFD